MKIFILEFQLDFSWKLLLKCLITTGMCLEMKEFQNFLNDPDYEE